MIIVKSLFISYFYDQLKPPSKHLNFSNSRDKFFSNYTYTSDNRFLYITSHNKKFISKSKLIKKSIKSKAINNISIQNIEQNELSRKNLAIFVSGNGSNFIALHKSCKDNKINGDITCVISSNCDCNAVKYALSEKLPVYIYPLSTSRKISHPLVRPINSDTSLDDYLRQHYSIDYIILAGYLKLIPELIIETYKKKILNIHPALLPAFGGHGYYGHKVHEAVIKSGARYTGPTVHFVDQEYDSGKILAQRILEININDTPETLASRVLQLEHEIYTYCVSALCGNRIHWRKDDVPWILDLK